MAKFFLFHRSKPRCPALPHAKTKCWIYLYWLCGDRFYNFILQIWRTFFKMFLGLILMKLKNGILKNVFENEIMSLMRLNMIPKLPYERRQLWWLGRVCIFLLLAWFCEPRIFLWRHKLDESFRLFFRSWSRPWNQLEISRQFAPFRQLSPNATIVLNIITVTRISRMFLGWSVKKLPILTIFRNYYMGIITKKKIIPHIMIILKLGDDL